MALLPWMGTVLHEALFQSKLDPGMGVRSCRPSALGGGGRETASAGLA